MPEDGLSLLRAKDCLVAQPCSRHDACSASRSAAAAAAAAAAAFAAAWAAAAVAAVAAVAELASSAFSSSCYSDPLPGRPMGSLSSKPM